MVVVAAAVCGGGGGVWRCVEVCGGVVKHGRYYNTIIWLYCTHHL